MNILIFLFQLIFLWFAITCVGGKIILDVEKIYSFKLLVFHVDSM